MLQYKNLPLATSQELFLLLLVLYIYVATPILNFLPNLLKEICQRIFFMLPKIDTIEPILLSTDNKSCSHRINSQ
jgi:hypothetical protein